MGGWEEFGGFWKQIEPWVSGAAVLLVTAVAVGLVVWMRRLQQEEISPDEPDAEAEYRAAFERGEIDEAEYRKILEALKRQRALGG